VDGELGNQALRGVREGKRNAGFMNPRANQNLFYPADYCHRAEVKQAACSVPGLACHQADVHGIDKYLFLPFPPLSQIFEKCALSSNRQR